MYGVISSASLEFGIRISDLLSHILKWCSKSKNVRMKNLETYIFRAKVISTLILSDIIIITIIVNLYINIVTLK